MIVAMLNPAWPQSMRGLFAITTTVVPTCSVSTSSDLQEDLVGFGSKLDKDWALVTCTTESTYSMRSERSDGQSRAAEGDRQYAMAGSVITITYN
ncbi:hypothetical protein [Aquabacterium sp.]|uniref:hypothetical protein n=1 Tax=Aquabacterium sp. TaxID=1872578 RepID=UPI0025BA3D02|nr:hypothetical protein [Aquabacterium sp.]